MRSSSAPVRRSLAKTVVHSWKGWICRLFMSINQRLTSLYCPTFRPRLDNSVRGMTLNFAIPDAANFVRLAAAV